MKTVSLVATAGLCLLLAVFVMVQRERLRDAQAEVGRTLAALDAARRRADEADQRLAAAEKSRARAEEELKTRREGPAPAAKPGATGDMAAAAAGMAMLNTPAMQKMMSSMARGGLDQRYGPLFRKLKLSPADLAKFKDQLVEKQMTMLDVVQAAQTQGKDAVANGKAFTEVMGSVQGELDANIHALLGDAGFKQYEDFNQKADAYGLLDQVERRLGYTNSPLQSAQSEALLAVLDETARSSASAGASGKGATGAFLQGMAGANPMLAALTETRITETTITSAGNVLTPTQIEVLRQIQAEQEERANSFQGLRSLRPPAGKKTP